MNWLAWMAEHGLGPFWPMTWGWEDLAGAGLAGMGERRDVGARHERSYRRPWWLHPPRCLLPGSQAARHIHGFPFSWITGPGRSPTEFPTCPEADLVVTSYGTVARNPEHYQKINGSAWSP